MGEMRVNWASDNLAADLSEIFGFVWEIDDLGWAHECKIKRVEK